MQTTEDKTIKGYSVLRDDIVRLRDEIRLELHLAGMEAKSEWDKLEPKVQHVEDELVAQRDRVADATKKRASELATAMRSFVDKHLRAAKS